MFLRFKAVVLILVKPKFENLFFFLKGLFENSVAFFCSEVFQSSCFGGDADDVYSFRLAPQQPYTGRFVQ